MKGAKSILVVGGSGFLGSHIAARLAKEHHVYATFFRNKILIPGVTPVPFDAMKKDWIKRVIYATQPACIVYVAGSSDPFWVEKNFKNAERVHAGGAANVSGVADILQPKFIYVSDSRVFDGRRGNYSEGDIVLPFISLGKCKLSSENYVKGKSLNYIIARSSPLYGRGNGRNFSHLDRVRQALDRGDRVEADTLELHSFAPVHGFAELIARLVTSKIKNRIIHYGGLTKVTAFEFTRMFAERFGYDPSLVIPKIYKDIPKANDGTAIYDFSLNSSFVATNLSVRPIALEEGFDQLEQRCRASL